MDILAHMHVRINGIVMGSDRNLLGTIGNLLEELGAFLWKCELIKCSIIGPFIYNKEHSFVLTGGPQCVSMELLSNISGYSGMFTVCPNT